MPDGKRKDPYADAISPRLEALERVFGKHSQYLASPIPFYLDGGATKIGFDGYLKDHVVYCTSEMTGWDSGQKPSTHGKYELLMVVGNDSELRPRESGDGIATRGYVGSILDGLARYSTQAVFRGGETVGPLDPALAPMEQVLFVDITNPKMPFQFAGMTHGLLLCMMITGAEAAYVREHGGAALVKKLREAHVFPVSSTTRGSVV